MQLQEAEHRVLAARGTAPPLGRSTSQQSFPMVLLSMFGSGSPDDCCDHVVVDVAVGIFHPKPQARDLGIDKPETPKIEATSE